LLGNDPPVIGTIEVIQRELVTDGFVHRHRTGPVPNLYYVLLMPSRKDDNQTGI
jgi:hypothetical protein